MITPLTSKGGLDRDAVPGLVEHLLGGGVSGIFILGTTGEGPSLTECVQHELIDATCAAVCERVPVLVGITDTAFGRSLGIANHAADAGATAVVLAPPSYYAAHGPDLLGYVARMAAELPLPLFLYNMPVHTKTFIDPDMVKAASNIPGVVGFKDSSCDMIHLHRIREKLKSRPDFSLLVGPEELLAEAVLFGAHGGVNGGANLAPGLYVALYHAAVAGDLPRIRNLHAELMMLASSLYTVGSSSVAIIQGLKCAMSQLGLCQEYMAEPFDVFSPVLRDELLNRFHLLQKRMEFLTPTRLPSP